MKLQFIIDKEYDKQLAKDFGKDNKTLNWMDDQYKTALKYLKLTQKLYQESWDEIGDDFSKYIEKTTGYNWYYDKYDCVVSVVHPGCSNWGNAPKIVRIWKENPYSMRRITAHELILSHYFEIYKRNYERESLSDNQVWALAEIAAWALTSLTPEVNKFWPWDVEYYTNHNYPQLVSLQNELKEAFLDRESFNEYIKTGITLVKKLPDIGPVL